MPSNQGSTVSSNKPPSTFIAALCAPYKSTVLKSEDREIQLWPDVRPEPSTQAELNPLAQPLYRPTGRWAWFGDLPFENFYDELVLSATRLYTTTIRRGQAGNREVLCMNKSWRNSGPDAAGFVTELAMYKFHLKPVQRAGVPVVIGVRSSARDISLMMELPHQSFFIEASADMPDVLKRRVVKALDEHHTRGVLHGDIDLSNFLIGADGRVTIINHHSSCSTTPNPDLYIKSTSEARIRFEMRELKFKLDYLGARKQERDRLEAFSASMRRNEDERLKAQANCHYRPNYESMPEEVKADPPLNCYLESCWSAEPEEGPRRIVIPGQSAKEFEEESTRFFQILLKLDAEDVALGFPSSNLLPFLNLCHSAIRRPPMAVGPSLHFDRPHSSNQGVSSQDVPSSSQDVPMVCSSKDQGTRNNKLSKKHGNTKFGTSVTGYVLTLSHDFILADHHQGAVERSIYLNNLHPTHPFIVVRDFAYEPGGGRSGVLRGKGKRWRQSEDDEEDYRQRSRRKRVKVDSKPPPNWWGHPFSHLDSTASASTTIRVRRRLNSHLNPESRVSRPVLFTDPLRALGKLVETIRGYTGI